MSSVIQWTKDAPDDKRDRRCPELYSISAEQIFPFLLDMDIKKIHNGVKPSQVFAALKLTTEERLEKLRSPQRKYRIGSKKDAFSRCPEAIIFQNFTTGVTYRTTLTVTNQRMVPQNLNVYFDTSRFFTLTLDTEHCNLTKIAPGMSNVLHISFVPTDSYRDYVQPIHFTSEDSCFSVPIFGLGPRPLANMPDKVILPSTLVKVESIRTIILKNSGEMHLNFSKILTEPFSCNPAKAILPANGFLEEKYSCYPTKPGYITGKADIYFRSVFPVVVELECDVKSVKVELDSHLISFEDIYVGLCSRKTLTLRNSSEYPLNFAWKINDQDEEECAISKLVGLMSEMKEYEQNRYEKLRYIDIVDAEGHANIYERIFHDEKQELFAKQTFLYRSDFFEIIPKVGKILPKSQFEFSVVFAPRQNILYYTAAYLDIEGTERRVRVSLQGSGIGPPILLTVKDLNVGQIYLTDKHQYELGVINKGVIPARVSFQPKKTDWGGVLTCIPQSIIIGPDSTKAFVVVFYTEIQGEFIETLDFKVEESGTHLQCIIKGNVICPLLKCIPQVLAFGTVSVGIKNMKEIFLINDSRVNIQYEFQFEKNFKEIGEKFVNIVPRQGKVYASSKVSVKITFFCDVSSEWETSLLLIMWNSPMYTYRIPFSCSHRCPKITSEPDAVIIKFCFLNCEYNRAIKLTNKTDLPGYVEYIPNKDSEDSSIICILNKTKIYFDACETVQLELKITVSSLGPHELPLQFAVIGGSVQTICTICCNGQGPVVSYYPDEVNFGQIDVLSKYSKKLTLINDSPILANVRVYCKSNLAFYIEENESILEVKPEENIEVNIWALFNNPGITKDTIYVEIYQGDVCTIRVTGEGVGTSILCEPSLAPCLNLGTVLTYKIATKEIKITNKGILRHKILFSRQPTVRSIKADDGEDITSIFKILPSCLEIEPNEVSYLTIKGCIKKPKMVTEEYYCHALIGKSPQVQTIMNFLLEAEFVDPTVRFANSNITFNLEVTGNVVEGNTEDVINIDNTTGIPLHINFVIDDEDKNFTLVECGEASSRVTFDMNYTSNVAVCFRPIIKEKRRNLHIARVIVEYENHPKTEIVDLRGEIMFPTVKLYPRVIDFHCVPLGSTSQKNVVIKNVSNMMVNFKWFWLEKSITINPLEPVKDVSRGIKITEEASNVFMAYIDPKAIDLEKTAEIIRKPSVDIESIVRSRDDAMKLTYDSNKYLGEMNNILSAVLFPYISQNHDQLRTIFKNQKFDKGITKLFSLEPSEGILNPGEYSIVTIGFNPPPNTAIQATAICKIEGGEEECLLVRGKSSKLSYKLDKNSVNYGNQVFCEMCTNQLTLTNNGLCSIDFKVALEESISMQAEMIDVHPKNGNIAPDQSVIFKIDYFPGFPGDFNKSFMLELGYLEPVMVNVHGYAVLSQVFLQIPRQDMELDITDCYKAVAWITPEYLEFVQSNDYAEMNDDPDDPTMFLEEYNWVYVSYNDSYPNLMDIDMAMERIVAFNLMNKNPKLLKDHTFSKKIPYIPQFSPPPYCVDFGYVVRDVPVCYTVFIYNYGPTKTEIKLIEDNKTALLEKEIKIEFKPGIFSPGETVVLYVIFAPTRRKCLFLNKQIDDVFRLSVRHGPLVSVQIKGEVTLPIVSLEYEQLSFERVYCGDVLRKTIILSNNGNVKSKWFASISKPTRKGDARGFFIIPNAGELDPGKKSCVDIYFVPSDTSKIKRTLRIDIESNTDPVFMDLFGEGIESSLMIVPTELKFLPTLSYFEQTLTFAVQNMSEIPMEFYFPTFDCETEQDNLLTQVYLRYKNLKHVFIPMRKAGTGLPDFFRITYNDLVEKLRNKISAKPEESEDMSENQNGAVEDKRNNKSYEVEDPLAKYSPIELHSLLMEYISADGFEDECAANSTIYRMDDSSDKIEIVEPLPKLILEEVERKGVLFIFHGAPKTDYYRGASQVGIALSIPVYSIDRLIIESLVEDIHPNTSEILKNINDKFMEVADNNSYVRPESLEIENSEYDKILDKINIILTVKPKKSSKKSPPKEKESKASSEKSQMKSKDKPVAVGDCFLDITSDFLVDLLIPKMKQFSHLIIESLNSIFIPQENLALSTLLKAAGPIQYINLILFSFTLEDYIKNEEMKIQTTSENNKGEQEKSKFSQLKLVPQKSGKTSTKAGSEKVSKSSRAPGKGGEMNKKILQNLNKTLKAQLEGFESLRHEICHVAQHWDKRSATLKKLYNAPNSPKKDTGTKEPTRTSKSVVKKPTSVPNNIDENVVEPGLTFLLVLNSSNERSIDFPEMIRNYVSRDSALQTVLNEIEESQQETIEESETTFSIISKPTTRKNDQLSEFIIKNFHEKENNSPARVRSKSASVGSIMKRKRSMKSSRRSGESKHAADVTLPFFKVENDGEFSARTTISSGDIVRYQVTFCPHSCGVYHYTYELETTRDKVQYQVICHAVCEFPKIDLNPEVMFPRTLENYREKASYDHFVFIKDQKIFDFGSIIARSSPDKSLDYSTTILLRNACSSVCDVAVSLNSDIFSIEPSQFTIESKGEDVLKVVIKPTKVGTVTAQLYISIKNNPKVINFTLACSPCKLEFSIYPRMVNFDKIPLFYNAKRIVRLTNTSPINLRWEFVDPAWTTEIFDLSQETGYIGLYSVSDIVFRFRPTEEMSFPKRYLPIRVFDVNSSTNEPCFTENIIIHADSVEYNLELEDHIDYGEIKGGIDHKLNFAISNKGKCEIILKIEMINNPLERHNFVREYFKIQPLMLVIGAQKTENLSIVFHPKNSFSISNVLVFVVSMVESIQTGYVVKSYKVTVSATSFMPSYKLCPQSHMNFGYVPLLSSKKLTMELTNKGRFSFSFVLLKHSLIVDSHKKEPSGKKSRENRGKKGEVQEKVEKSSQPIEKKTKTKSETSKGTSNKTDKKKVTKVTRLDVGNFTIVPSSGIVEPNDKFVIEIGVNPTEIKEYVQEILLNIAEIEDIKKTKVIILEATGCEPNINLKDFESIFIEQYITSNIDDFVNPKNVEGCCVYSSSDNSLYFKLVCINTAFMTKIQFKNIGYVTSHLTAKIDDFGKNVFTITPATKVLEPHSSYFLKITFKPYSLEQVTGNLEISYNASKDNKLIVQLYGQACLPQIKLLKPLYQTNETILNIGPICVGHIKTEQIAFKNVGQIKCKVIVEISAYDDVLTIIPTSSTFKQLNVQDEDCIHDMRREIMVNLLLDEIAEFDIVYKPVKQDCFQANLNLHIVSNPYESTKILINATSYDDDITLEELEPTKLNLQQSSHSPWFAKNPIGYLLDLGYKELNKLYKKSFLIRNRSQNDTYKFKFYFSSVIFIPEVGHLKPGACKEILVIFKTATPLLLEMEEIACNINKIKYVYLDLNALSWDDRQKFVCWISDVQYSVKSIESSTTMDKSNISTGFDEIDSKPDIRTRSINEGAEPEITIIADSLNIIPLYLSVSADYCRYECEVSTIDFMDTYITEESIQEFEVKNIGSVPITISWSLWDKNIPCVIKSSHSETNITQNSLLRDRSLKSASCSSIFSSATSTEIETFLPITIKPEKTIIEQGENRTFSLFFKPQEENRFEAILQSSIEALDPSLEEIRIEVNANASPIPFYFEMDDGFLTNKDIVLDFENIGVATISTRKILLVNPSDEQVSFEILTKDNREFSYFVCDTPRGHINKKKKCFTMFSFRPPILGSFQECYTLNIPEKDVQKNILLQGLCREPKVYFSEINIILKPTVPKVKTIKALKFKNEEKFPISFKFIKKSLLSECQQERLEAYPIVGKLQPQSESDIKLTFKTSNIVSASFHIKCIVEKLKTPLNLHVSANCTKVQPLVSFVNKNGEVIRLLEDEVNIVDLGSTYKGRRDVIQFKIANQGGTGIFYTWEFDSKPIAHLFKISVDNEKDFIKSDQTATIQLAFESLRTGTLKLFKINLNIMYGPNYEIHVNAISSKPCYAFSFNAYNFGYCFTQTGQTNYYSTVLCFSNLDSKAILLENLFEKTDYLTVDFSSSKVLPGETRNIPIHFYPPKVGSYKAEVLFLLGGNKHIIPIIGEAVNINLELCNPKDKFINFGEVLVTTMKKYRVGVCNNSPARLDVHFDIYDNLVIHTKKIMKLDKNKMKMPVLPPPPKETKKEKGGKKGVKSEEGTPKSDKKSDKGKNKKEEEKQAEDVLATENLLKKQEERREYLKNFIIVPSMFIDIPPKGKSYFDITFQPDVKMDFEEKIYFETQDCVEPLCVIKGSSIISEFTLDKKEVLFAGVIIGCSSTQLITLRNTGDIIGSFIWKIEEKQNIFNIQPKQGFVLPKNDMKIKITFLPKHEKCELKIKAKCVIKEFKGTLQLVLKGNSIKMPEPAAKIDFKCNVREKVEQSVMIPNNTSEQWLLQPEISHEAFSTPEEVISSPFSNTPMVVTYFPKMMTLAKPDMGKLFIKIPDGSGLLYDLIGIAGPPTVKKKIEKEINCKENVFEIIPIENWLTIKQTFKVITEVISPITMKTLYSVLGFKSIELNGMETKYYKWGVYVVNEGPIEFRLTFKNTNTGEYEFFEISLKALPSKPIKTIFFHARVREPITKQINLKNPVDIPVTYLLESTERSLSFAKSINMEPHTTAKIDVTYAPLQAEDVSTSITARCEELGTFTYLIKMNAESPKLEECIIFKSEIGSKATKTIVFKNIFDRIVEFSYKFDDKQFYMERCGPISAGDSTKIAIAFEPSILGHSKNTMVLTSPVAGEYIYPLDGEGIPPTPKGPFAVKLNYPTTIEFKNPFDDDKHFKFQLQPDTFCCDFNEDVIKSRQTARFLIYFRPPTESKYSCPVTGKLIIYSDDLPELQWKYYLQFNSNS